MAQTNPYPLLLINYRAYLDGTMLFGTADVTLPSIENLTEDLKGAGIAGSLNVPVLGHYNSLKVGIKWLTIDTAPIQLAEPIAHRLVFRASEQIYDAGSGQQLTQRVVLRVVTLPNKIDLGKMEVATATDTANELECVSLKLTVANNVLLDLDKLNFRAIINGTDYLAGVRADLGM